MAPVVKACKLVNFLDTKVLVTAQHREMLDQVLKLYDIVPDFDLDLMSQNQGLNEVTSKIMLNVRAVYDDYKPDMVFVHGDTTTAMAAALAAFYSQIPIAHVEAGLRTGYLKSPWPEEMNRRFIGMIGNLHFAPTENAKNNLLLEGVDPDKVFVIGNTAIDSVSLMSSKLAMNDQLTTNFDKQYSLDGEKKLILITGHRRENFGGGLERICEAILSLSKRDDVQIIYPVHLNPNVRKPVRKLLSNCRNVTLVEPMEYLPFVHLMLRSYLILTDSGGIQEEASFLCKPVLVMRDSTERSEAIDAGSVKLVGTNPQVIVNEVTTLIDHSMKYQAMASAVNPYGDGQSAGRMISILEKLIDQYEGFGS